MKNLHISDYYENLLKGKTTTVSREKSYKIIKDNNQSRLENVALSENEREITYREMFEKWDEYARVFSSLGITEENDSRVMVLMPNVAQTCYIDYGLNITGGVADFADPTSPYDKLEKYIENEKITDIIISDAMYEQLLKKHAKDIKEKYGIKNIVLINDKFFNDLLPLSKPVRTYLKVANLRNKFDKNVIRFEDALKDAKFQKIVYGTKDSSELSLITHTSGTTSGIGKPIPITDYNRNALVKQHELAELKFEPGMKMLHFIPYFAAYGAINTANLGLSMGMELQQIPLFKPADFGKMLAKHKPNIVLSIMPAWMSLIDDENLKDVDLSFLSCAVSGGSPTRNEDEERLNEFLEAHGCKVKLTKGYGLSELCGCGTYTIDDYNKIGSMGVQLPLTKIKIRDNDTGKLIEEKGKEISGEALLHSPSMTSGILDGNTVVETIEIDGEKYLPTKDIVRVDEEGCMYFVDRKDRMFPRYDAYNVYPSPLENMFKKLEEIDNCVIVPYFDEDKNGNMPKIYIQSDMIEENDRKIWIEAIIDRKFLNNHQDTDYKANFRDIPREWCFVNQMPKNTMGKDDYHLLKTGEVTGDMYRVEIIEDNMSVKDVTIQKKELPKQKIK